MPSLCKTQQWKASEGDANMQRKEKELIAVNTTNIERTIHKP